MINKLLLMFIVLSSLSVYAVDHSEESNEELFLKQQSQSLRISRENMVDLSRYV